MSEDVVLLILLGVFAVLGLVLMYPWIGMVLVFVGTCLFVREAWRGESE